MLIDRIGCSQRTHQQRDPLLKVWPSTYFPIVSSHLGEVGEIDIWMHLHHWQFVLPSIRQVVHGLYLGTNVLCNQQRYRVWALGNYYGAELSGTVVPPTSGCPRETGIPLTWCQFSGGVLWLDPICMGNVPSISSEFPHLLGQNVWVFSCWILSCWRNNCSQVSHKILIESGTTDVVHLISLERLENLCSCDFWVFLLQVHCSGCEAGNPLSIWSYVDGSNCTLCNTFPGSRTQPSQIVV